VDQRRRRGQPLSPPLRVVEKRPAGPPFPGGDYILDSPDVEIICGSGTKIVWAKGEPLLIVGPQGVGKTTVKQQLALARAGLQDSVLGFPVEPDSRCILYVAADRPTQARRSLARMISEEDRTVLNERLEIWPGPLPFDLASRKGAEAFGEFLREGRWGTVFIDALKDVTSQLSPDDAGLAINHAFQLAMALDVQLCIGHHQRKAQGDNSRPNRLDDVHGNANITRGCGSVILLWGNAGDREVELRHLKPVMDIVGPLRIVHDHAKGTSRAANTTLDVIDVVLKNAELGATLIDVAIALYNSNQDADLARARRRLEKLVKEGILTYEPGAAGGRRGGALRSGRWRLVEPE